ncbi:MAG: aldose 1-epimerase [Acidobacteria bacterium]|nr:aldose 1-epimerase [Acidobacteriota bacterium]
MAYSARTTSIDGIDTVQLADSARDVQLAIAPSVGNMAYSWTVHGKNYLHFPYASVGEFARQPRLCAVPFLGPWANRIDGDSYWANGKRYLLNPDLGNLRRDGNRKPIHGLLNFSPDWKLVEAKADENSAWSVSRLEYWRHPDLMAQFPFPHTLTMTYRLRDGAAEVETAIENHGVAPMPVAIGFHPYFRLHDAPRDQWHVHLAARDHMLLNPQLIPTGESKPLEFEDPHALASSQLDDVFGGLVRDADGRARFWVEAGRERVTVDYGPRYTTAVVYAPRGQEFICFEPMSAITNGFNLAHEGRYKDLQSVAPGETWRETFRLHAEVK